MRRALLALALLASVLLIPTAGRAEAAPLRILAVGDSITADGRWQAELDRLLTTNGVLHSIDTEAVGGTSCAWWPTRMAAILAAHQPDLVILYCGTNDDPNRQAYGEPETRWAMRSMIEAAHSYRPGNPPKILPSLIGMSDPMMSPQWLLDNEYKTVDNLWVAQTPYRNSGWFAGLLDLQQLPATADYLDGDTCNPATATCSVHPNAKGYRTIGQLAYRAVRASMGWPDTVPQPCGMYGHRRLYPRPTYTACP